MKISSLALSVVPFLAAVAATPVTSTPRGIDRNLFSQFEFFSQFAAAAYCRTNLDGRNSKVICPVGNCPLVQQDDTVTLGEFENSAETGTTGFVAADHTRRIVVVSFRGSHSRTNWDFNFKTKQIPTGLCPGCDGHEGFFRSWMDVRERVFDALRTAAQQHPDYTVILTGHSLGAAVAAFGFLDLLKSGLVSLVYMYGSPKIGNRALLDHLNAQRRAFHIAHQADPFTQVPFEDKYAYALPMFALGGGQQPGPGDIRVLPSVQNIFEVLAQNPWNVGAHMGYFGRIAACS